MPSAVVPRPIKLVDASGDILGAIIVPEEAVESWLRRGEMVFYLPPAPVRVFGERNQDAAHLETLVFISAHTRPDAVMLVKGSLYDFEKARGCFFIPGYSQMAKGRR